MSGIPTPHYFYRENIMKERILLVNKFYYRRGGDCVVTMDLEQLLLNRGHEVAVFAMKYPENIHSQWSDMFASEVNFSGGIAEKLHAAYRALGGGDIRRSFKAILDRFNPDVVHLHNIHSYLSPVLAQLAHARGARVVWTLHDYKLICPTYACLDPGGNVCEACLTDKNAVLTHRCHKGSLAASFIAWLEAAKWSRERLERYTNMFICPSQFMADKMIQAGFSPSKITVLNNFHDSASHKTEPSREDFYLYAGRLSREKGVETLLKAAASLEHKLIIAGDGPLASELRHRYAGYANIVFVGHINGTQVRDYMSRARFTLIPSQWYENNPLGVIESLSAGTPVLGADMGGIPELINDNNGKIFPHGDIQSLIASISDMWYTTWDFNSIADSARIRFSPDTHYSRISAIYSGSK